MNKRVCTICKIEKELSEYYTQPKKKKGGTEYVYCPPYCKECTKKKTKQWQQIDNREKYLETKSKHNKQYFSKQENKVRHKEIVRKSREKGYSITWQRSNPDKVKGYNIKRNGSKKHNISNNEWDNCKNYFNYRCAYCSLPIEEHYIVYRGNLQLGDFHKEHVDDDGSNDLSNCIPSCKVCNCSKHDLNFNDWYNKENENFTYERLEKINKWLNEDYKKYIEVK